MRRTDWEQEDDGRTIADMSEIGGPALLFPRGRRRGDSDGGSAAGESASKQRPWEEESGLSRKERGWAALGAMKAALLIGLAYIVGFGALILLLLALWT